jgi:hypothetical protein
MAVSKNNKESSGCVRAKHHVRARRLTTNPRSSSASSLGAGLGDAAASGVPASEEAVLGRGARFGLRRGLRRAVPPVMMSTRRSLSVRRPLSWAWLEVGILDPPGFE